ncbi:MAG: hypothetical protein O7G85_05925, partial [Planctomycetota bacterium]|nr:hypothetical protein [Planctomycetota bacterium]
MRNSNRGVRGFLTSMMLIGTMGLATIVQGGGVRYVDDDAPAGGDGLAWGTAYRFLQDALSEAAASGGAVTEIRVGQGTYRPDRDEVNQGGTGDRAATFSLRDGVALRGGYEGFGAADPDVRDISLFPSMLDGDLLGNDLVPAGYLDPTKDENTYHIVTGSGNDATAMLDGFIIQYAATERGAVAEIYGGGMIIVSGSPTITDCTFLGNMAEFGAGLYVAEQSMPSISNCHFNSNYADELGGGMMIEIKSHP